MRIVSFLTKRPGRAFVNGKELEMDELFVLLQDPCLNTESREVLKSFLKANGFLPHSSLNNIEILGNIITFKYEGLTFSKKLDEISPGRNVYHPNGWMKHKLSDEEISLISSAKRRWKMLY